MDKRLPLTEMATFQAVNDNIFDFGAAKGIQNPAMAQVVMGSPVMDRP